MKPIYILIALTIFFLLFTYIVSRAKVLKESNDKILNEELNKN